MAKKKIASYGMALALAFAASPGALAQPYIISTYAGGIPPPTPALGTVSTVSTPEDVVTDATGNVYFSSGNCVFRLDQSGVLTRVAGTSRAGNSGDGGSAASAQLWSPTGLAIDSAGNLYIADTTNNRIRKVTPGGVISTVAGNGSFAYFGDGGIATSAQINAPWGLAVDGANNLYIADTGNNRVRKVTPDGIITTLAGTGNPGYSGDGGPAGAAQLNRPVGLAVDSANNVYIADTTNNRVRMVSPSGKISTVAGKGSQGYSGDGDQAINAQLGGPFGVAVTGGGTLYIADNGSAIRRVSTAGIITTVAGGNGVQGYQGDGGTATSARLYYPFGVAVDGAGNLYIADYGNNRIRKVTAAGIISTVAGNGTLAHSSGDGGPAASAEVKPQGVALDLAGNLYITDVYANRVRKVTRAGIISTVAGNGSLGSSGDGGAATDAQLYAPHSAAVDIAGNLYIADTSNSRVRKVTPAGTISTVAGILTSAGFSGDGGPANMAKLDTPYGVAVDIAGNLYVADTNNNRIRKVTAAGTISTVGAGSLYFPQGVAVDVAGNIYIADYGNQRIRKVTPDGVVTTVAGTGIQGHSGDGGLATNAQINRPTAIALDGAGNLYIAFGDDGRIRKVDPAGIISTIAGNGSIGYSGDGGFAMSAQLWGPEGLAVDNAGRVYVADAVNSAVRLLQPLGAAPSVPVLLTAGVVPAGSSVNTLQAGEWVAIYGSNLASSVKSWDGIFVESLIGTSVTINGRTAYPSYVSPGQVNVQAPDDLATGTVAVVVTTAQGAGVGTVTLAPTAPSFLLLDKQHVAGIILRNDGSGAFGSYDILGPTGSSLGYPAVAAKEGDSVVLFAVGLGPTTPSQAAGQSFAGALPTDSPVNVFIDSVSVTPGFAGLSGAGLYQINLTVPAGLGAGDRPLSALVSGTQTQAGVVITLR